MLLACFSELLSPVIFICNFTNGAKVFFGGRESLGKVLSFIIVFIVVTMLIDWIFVILEKIFNLISIIPFTKTINRLLGGALGFWRGHYLSA